MAPLEIICAHHRVFPRSDSPAFLNIHAGKVYSGLALGLPGDDTGDNISDLNPYFSEMSAVYWYWRNRPLADAVGVCHYRRYFDPWGFPKLRRSGRLHWLRVDRRPVVDVPVGRFVASQVTTDRAVDAIARVMRSPMILTAPIHCRPSVREHYLKYQPGFEWARLIEVLRDHGESGSLHVFDGPTLYALNMTVMNRDLFEEYMSWLFPILFDFHAGADYSVLHGNQKRSLGYVAEWLLTLFVISRGLDVPAPKMRVIRFVD